MKKLVFHYEMKSTFTDYVGNHSFTLKCMPQSNSFQEITIKEHDITPATWISRGSDFFQNEYIYGKAKELHNHLDVIIEGEAKVHRLPTHEEETIWLYRDIPTDLTRVQDSLLPLAEKYQRMVEQYPELLKDHMDALMREIHQCMNYVPGVTTIHTSAEEAFQRKTGVCQDYSHIMLAICRYIKIPCLYIAGFMVGEGASHAWVRIYDKVNKIFYDIDPTNNRWVNDEYIDVSKGKDARDCIMNQGIYMGFAEEIQRVVVYVKEEEEI